MVTEVRSSLPRRQLRNKGNGEPSGYVSSLPRRQLRNAVDLFTGINFFVDESLDFDTEREQVETELYLRSEAIAKVIANIEYHAKKFLK